MRHSIKISLMALMAMFAFSTVADAQFGLGGLVKAAKKAVKGNKKTEVVLPGTTEPVKVKGEIKPYDENAALGEDMVRTIFMLGDQKMMLDQPVADHYRSSYSSSTMSISVDDVKKESVQKRLNWTWKDAGFMERAKEDFYNKHKDRSLSKLLQYAGSAEKWKVGNIGTDATGWQYNRDNWGNITYRYFKVYILFELEDGQNIMAPFEVCENNAGGGSYDEDTLLWNFSGWGDNRGNYYPRAVNIWEVKTDCYTSKLTGK